MQRMTLGRYVHQRRTALGLRSEDVAAAIGRNQSWVSRLETGDSKVFPDPEDLHALAVVLQVTPRELLEADGYLSAESRGEHVLVNPFGVDDPRWAVVEALKRHPLTSEQSQAVQALLPFFSPGE